MAASIDVGHQSANNAHCVTVSYDSCESLKSTVSSRGNGTLASASIPNCSHSHHHHNRHKRISILKRLKEKLSSTDSLTLSSTYADAGLYHHQDGQPTVIRVGTVSSGTSTVRSWRVVDDFLRGTRFDFSSPSRQSTVSNRSMSSGKTFIYDDKSLEINKPDFCTVIKVEDCPTTMTGTVVAAETSGIVATNLQCNLHETLHSSPAPMSLENVNVIIEQHNNDSSSSLSSSPSTVRTVHNNNLHTTPNDDAERNSSATGDNSYDNNKPADQSCSERTETAETREALLRNSLAASSTEPHLQNINLNNTSLFHPLPSIILPPTLTHLNPNALFPPQPRVCASGSSPIELTNWRVRADFDADPSSRTSGECNNNSSNQRSSDQSSANNGFNLNLLTPDDLPRLYPGWNMPMPPPFRFDEEFEEEPKGCCGSSRFSHSMLIRVFIAVISLIGLSCVIVGIVLGALTVSGSTRLTLCLLMIGVGVVLIIVSGIAWRLTSLDPSVSPSCWTILGLRAQRPQSVFPERRSRTAYYRVRNVRRPVAPFCGMVQSEFAWRPPPPTYQATMQEMRLQNFLCARNRVTGPSGSPPPTYRSDNDVDARPSLNDFIQRISRPPSYRSHESIQAASIEERPLLPTDVVLQNTRDNNNDRQLQQQQQQHVEQNQDVASNGCAEGSAVANTERVQNDDRAKLVAHDHLQRTNSSEQLPSTSSGDSCGSLERQTNTKRETVSVIDCSSAEPVVTVGVDVPQRSTRPVVVTSPQNSRHQSNRRYGYPAETVPRRTVPNLAPGYFRAAAPQLMPRGVIRPGHRDDFPLRYPMPFVPGRGPHHHHPRPLVPIRVGPTPLRWRMPPQNANMQIHQRLPTVAANVRDEHMTNVGPFSEIPRDPSYV